eukprot:3470316-Prorocentrum_lima.AAC.1
MLDHALTVRTRHANIQSHQVNAPRRKGENVGWPFGWRSGKQPESSRFGIRVPSSRNCQNAVTHLVEPLV